MKCQNPSCKEKALYYIHYQYESKLKGTLNIEGNLCTRHMENCIKHIYAYKKDFPGFILHEIKRGIIIEDEKN